jgi:hypothetical protein
LGGYPTTRVPGVVPGSPPESRSNIGIGESIGGSPAAKYAVVGRYTFPAPSPEQRIRPLRDPDAQDG